MRIKLGTSTLLLLAFATTPLAAATPGPERIEKIASERCEACHGQGGQGNNAMFPKLSGQNANYLVQQMFNFKSGARRSPTMQPMVTELSEADFAALGAWYASRPTHVHPVEDPAVAFAGRTLWTGGNPPAGVERPADEPRWLRGLSPEQVAQIQGVLDEAHFDLYTMTDQEPHDAIESADCGQSMALAK